MRAAVIGTGVMGNIHARVYSSLGILSGAFDVDTEKATQTSFRYKTSPYSSLQTLLDTKPDIVSVAVPTPLHKEVAIKCMEAGCHVLLEKPISNSIPDAKEIVNKSKELKKVLAVGYIERFNPAVRALVQDVATNQFGKLTSINIKRVGGIPRSADNVIVDLMTHDLDILSLLMTEGAFLNPKDFLVSKQSNNGIVDSAQALLDYGSVSATCESNWISPVKIRQICVTGTKGYAELDLVKQTYKRLDEVGKRFNIPLKKELHPTKDSFTLYSFNQEPLLEEIKTFISAVENKYETSRICSGEEAINTLQLTLQIAGKTSI